MKNFALKLWWIMNFISFILMVISYLWVSRYLNREEEIINYISMICLVGFLLYLFSNILIMHISTFLKKEDEIDEAWEKYRSKERELDKLVEFLKTKAFRSTIVTREEIYKHMKWKDDESRNQQ